KIAFVTGGSRGIGAAIARHLAGRGADVAITYVNTPDRAHALAQALRATGVRAQAYAADAASPDQVRQAVGQAAHDMGGWTFWSITPAFSLRATWPHCRRRIFSAPWT